MDTTDTQPQPLFSTSDDPLARIAFLEAELERLRQLCVKHSATIAEIAHDYECACMEIDSLSSAICAGLSD